jgi:hypothetical protein
MSDIVIVLKRIFNAQDTAWAQLRRGRGSRARNCGEAPGLRVVDQRIDTASTNRNDFSSSVDVKSKLPQKFQKESTDRITVGSSKRTQGWLISRSRSCNATGQHVQVNLVGESLTQHTELEERGYPHAPSLLEDGGCQK